jgi:cell division protein FtsB
MFLTSSQDLLYIVMALSILWFTIFLCWLLYQAARVLKNANDIIEVLTQKLELITEAVTFMRKKVDDMSSHMGIVGKIASGFVDKYVVSRLTDKLDAKIAGKRKKKK